MLSVSVLVDMEVLYHAAVRWIVVLAVLAACKSEPAKSKPTKHDEPAKYDPYRDARETMVERHIVPRGIEDPRVLEAMRHVPRHELVPEENRHDAYEDRPLQIGFGKTISQPFIVAAMTAAAKLRPGDKVLEIGTGSGYQAAVLAELGNEVYTIELIPELAERAAHDLKRIGYGEVTVRHGDGYAGWAERAPFDAILVTAAAPVIPPLLYEELVVGGRLVIPIGDDEQLLQVVTRTKDGPSVETLMEVRFSAMVGDPQ
jgi:protein-L-isoaspartate(D-aspartate) O-methyltransferase